MFIFIFPVRLRLFCGENKVKRNLSRELIGNAFNKSVAGVRATRISCFQFGQLVSTRTLTWPSISVMLTIIGSHFSSEHSIASSGVKHLGWPCSQVIGLSAWCCVDQMLLKLLTAKYSGAASELLCGQHWLYSVYLAASVNPSCGTYAPQLTASANKFTAANYPGRSREKHVST